MNRIILIIVLLLLLLLWYEYESSTPTTGTAILAPDGSVTTPIPTTTADNGSFIDELLGDTTNGLSPVDIGGVSMVIPVAVMSWEALADKYAQINSILDPSEILAIIWNESTGNPNAQNPGDPSWGLMGVTLLIGKAYAGVTVGTQLFNADTNVKAGSGYLAYLKNKYGDASDWADAYNVGETKYNQGIRSVNNGGYSQAFIAHVNAIQGIG